MKAQLLLIAALLTGCAAAPFDLSKLDANQAKAANGLVLINFYKGLGPGYAADVRQIVYDATSVSPGITMSPDGTIGVVAAVRPAPLPKASGALCDDSGQAFAMIEGKLLRTPAEDAKCQKPVAPPSAATDARDQAEIDAVKASRPSGR